MKEAQGYVHAAQMMQFAEDATLYPRPWELWEVQVDSENWKRMTSMPIFLDGLYFRRNKHADLIGAWQLGAKIQMEYKGDWRTCDPDWSGDEYRIKPKTININGYEVPEPVREELSRGSQYWIADLDCGALCRNTIWHEFECDYMLLKQGRIHLTEEAASIHAQALLSFTRAK